MSEDNKDDFHIVDLAATEGYLVDDSDEDDPTLITSDGHRVDTWRDGYPYEERMSRDEYERIKRSLQIELLKWQNWTKDTPKAHHPL